ncbi:hypothetical protein CAEBREN_16761 [Caenorhabditis brenneri]|uniref:F-box associated domain-containing protein n=1 Tax=Caenorhabditis brenneri TaxID=135651 RepID=G0PN56_CAEBE|nr:hypothetical protein CAEBREN_16761 [Caenorhabditis brenneri]
MTRPEQYLLSKCSRRASQMVIISVPKNNNHEIWVKFGRDTVILSCVIVQFFLKTAESIVLIHTAIGEFSPEDHRFICDLFRAPLAVYAIWEEFNPNSDKFPTNCAVKRTNLLEFQWSFSSLKEFSELHPRQDLVLLHGSYVHNLDRDHAFLGARNLMLSSIGGNSPINVLSSFYGEHLLMEDFLISKFFIEVFVDKWMKTSNDRLKSVIFKLNPQAVIGNLKYDKFCGSDRQYHYDSP